MKKMTIVFLMTLFVLWGCNGKEGEPLTDNGKGLDMKDNIVQTEDQEESLDQEKSTDITKENDKNHENTKLEEEDEVQKESKNSTANNRREKELKVIEDIRLVGELNEFDVIEGIRLYIGKEMDKYIDVSNNSAIGGSLEVKDVDNDGTKDIIVYEFLGGSGNVQNIYIYKRVDEDISKIMGPDKYVSQDNFYQEYLGDGNIYFEDRNTGFKKEYNILVPYENEGWSIEEVKSRFGMGDKAWVDPYSSFQVVDEDGGGLFEIRANQIICGVAHVDLIGEMTTIYGLEEGKYIPKEVIYYKVDHKKWKSEEIGRAKYH